jgi:hypothetical protein
VLVDGEGPDEELGSWRRGGGGSRLAESSPRARERGRARGERSKAHPHGPSPVLGGWDIATWAAPFFFFFLFFS